MAKPIVVQIIGDDASLQKALARSSAQVESFGSKLQASGKKISSVGSTLTRNLTLPIVGVGVVAGKMAVDFATAMNHVQALTGASAKQTQAWSDQILKLAPKLGTAPTDFANALYFVASAGVKVSQVMPITTAAVKASAAGMGDAQTIAQLLTSAINAYGAKALNAKQATDILTESIKVGKAEPADLAANLGKVIPLAQAMGVTFAEASADIASLTNTGLSAAQAATGLRSALSGLLKPSSAAAAELKQVGFSVAGVQAEVKQKGLLATLLDLKNRVNGNKDAMAKLFPNVRALTAVLALTGKNSAGAAKNIDLVTNSTGALSKAFKTAQQGPAFQFHKELAQLQVDAIKLGNQLIPIGEEILGVITKMASAFGKLSPEEQTAVIYAGLFAASLGPILKLGGNVVQVVGFMAKGLTVFSAEAGTATVASEELAGASALGGIGLAATAIVGVGLGAWFLDSLGGLTPFQKAVKDSSGDIQALKGDFQNLHGAMTASVTDLHALKQAEKASDPKAATAAWNAYEKQQFKVGAAQTALSNKTRTLASRSDQATAAAHRQINASDQLRGANGRLNGIVQTYTNTQIKLAGQAGRYATFLQQHGTPAEVQQAKAVQQHAQAAAILAGKIKGIPTKHEVDIYVRTHIEVQNEVVTVRAGPLAGKPLTTGAEGGIVTGGTANKDSVPSLLMPGEVVLSKMAVARLGGTHAANSWNKSITPGAMLGSGSGHAAPVNVNVAPPPLNFRFYLDGKELDVRVEHAMNDVARRVQARPGAVWATT